MILQIIINGLLLGGLYTSIAVGFSLVWGVMNIINVAHGVLLMLGAYLTFWVVTLFGVDPFLTIPLSMGALFIVGYLIQKGIMNRIVRAPLFVTFIVTYGLGLIIENFALLSWGARFRSAAPSYSGAGVMIGSIIIPYTRIVISIISVAMTLGLFVFMKKTRTGMAIRATRMDLEAAKYMGIKISTIYAITFGIGAAMAGISGSLMSITYMITPVMGNPFTFLAFVICVLGGLGNINGALAGGIVFGLADTVGSVVLGTGWKDFIAMFILVIVLIFKPTGLVGMKYYEI